MEGYGLIKGFDDNTLRPFSLIQKAQGGEVVYQFVKYLDAYPEARAKLCQSFTFEAQPISYNVQRIYQQLRSLKQQNKKTYGFVYVFLLPSLRKAHPQTRTRRCQSPTKGRRAPPFCHLIFGFKYVSFCWKLDHHMPPRHRFGPSFQNYPVQTKQYIYLPDCHKK